MVLFERSLHNFILICELH